MKRDEVLVELDTDKVSLEVVAPEDGVLSAIEAEAGATVAPGQRLGQVGPAGAAALIAKPTEQKAEAKPSAAPPPKADARPAPPAVTAPVNVQAAPPKRLPGAPRFNALLRKATFDSFFCRKSPEQGARGGLPRATLWRRWMRWPIVPRRRPSPHARSTPAKSGCQWTRLRQTIAKRLKEAAVGERRHADADL